MKSHFGQRAVLAVCLGFLVSFAAGEVRSAKPTKTITGVVLRDEVNRGQVRSVFIRDAEEGEFLVLRGTEMGNELLAQVGATVKATGYVRKARPDAGFPYAIDVLEYEIIVPAEPPPPKPNVKSPKKK